MFRKIDGLILRNFAGPFIITFAVVVFILESQFLMRKIEYFLGKGIDGWTFGRLVFYFSLNMVPMAMPLGVLVSSLITFGNLGEHRELTAIKASGISLTRIIRPVFVVVAGMALGLFLFSNYVLPWANLQGWSLLYDLKQKKPTLEFKEGMFYSGLEGFDIRVGKKFEESNRLEDVVIYDHSGDRGNKKITIAKAGYTYSIMNDRYMVLDLRHGTNYSDVSKPHQSKSSQYIRSEFKRSKIVFSLSGFDLSRTDQRLFKGNKVMKNVGELKQDQDSMYNEIQHIGKKLPSMAQSYYLQLFKDKPEIGNLKGKDLQQALKSLDHAREDKQNQIYNLALNQSRNAMSLMRAMDERILGIHKNKSEFGVEFNKKFSMAVSCIILFLIGAPIGAIVKKGGLGMPLLISIVFFIIFYVLNMMGERWASADAISPYISMWMANGVLAVVGVYFMVQAYLDASIFEFGNMKDRFTDLATWIKNLFRPGTKVKTSH